MASMPEAVHAKAVLAAARGAVTADNGVVLREAACVASVDARAAPDPTGWRQLHLRFGLLGGSPHSPYYHHGR